MAFPNFSELYNAGGSFSKQEVIQGTGTTTIYGGYAPRAEMTAETDGVQNWLIRKLVVDDNGTVQTITCGWARGSWTDRATLNYTYFKP